MSHTNIVFILLDVHIKRIYKETTNLRGQIFWSKLKTS